MVRELARQPMVSGSNPVGAWMVVLSVCLCVLSTLGQTCSLNLWSPMSRRRERTMSLGSSVGCQLRCRPRHLTMVLNYEA